MAFAGSAVADSVESSTVPTTATPTTRPLRAHAGMTADEILALLRDESAPLADRMQAFRFFKDVTAPEQKRILQEAVLIDQADISAAAGVALFMLFADANETNLIKAIDRWSPTQQENLLTMILNFAELTPDRSKYETIARHVLSGAKPERQTTPTDVAYNIAALCLRTPERKANVQALLKFVRLHPTSVGAWRALAHYDAIGPAETQMLEELEDGDLTTIYAWSYVANAHRSVEAAKSANIRIQRAMTNMGLPARISPIAKLFHDTPPELSGDFTDYGVKWYTYINSLPELGRLRALRTYSAKAYTFKLIQSADPTARTLACLIAAERWPTELLAKLDKKKVGADEYEKLLALVMLKHPGLKDKFFGLIAPETLAGTVKEMRMAGFFKSFGNVGVFYTGLMTDTAD